MSNVESRVSLFGRKEDRGRAREPLFAEEERLAEREELNLLYVAITRAKQVFVASGSGALKSDTTPYARLSRALASLGVAPAEGSVPNGTPGPHGGNLDCTLMCEGNSAYFTVGVEGALFGAGDFHAVMGDGEIVVCGAEISGELRFKAEVVEGLKGLPTPFVQAPEVVATIYSAPTIDEAASGAIHRMAQFLTDFAKIPLNDAGMLMSLVGQLKFCQVVDPLKTVRFEFPKWVLAEYDFQMA